MHWFSWRVLGACALLGSACSDDGVPLATGGDTDGAATGTVSAGGTGDTAPGTAVTTAGSTSASASDSDATATTSPSGTDSDPGTDGTSEGSSGGTDGSSSGTGSTGGSTEPECVMDEDCMLVDDCCTCGAIPVGDEAPECDLKECLVSTCTSLGLGMPAVECNFGTCEVEEVSCDPTFVVCDEAAPECSKGQAPRVVDGCWGGCIPVEYCDVVPGCESCGEDEACVESVGQVAITFSCVPIPPSCNGLPSCECLGEACEGAFDACEDGIEPKSGAELTCSCPAC
ncbi:MAG: hypothetical protein KUG77_24195 [Nannocystaceae bacterium]|nr:hypothetical protein [Nannocystaceae bacterium]